MNGAGPFKRAESHAGWLMLAGREECVIQKLNPGGAATRTLIEENAPVAVGDECCVAGRRGGDKVYICPDVDRENTIAGTRGVVKVNIATQTLAAWRAIKGKASVACVGVLPERNGTGNEVGGAVDNESAV